MAHNIVPNRPWPMVARCLQLLATCCAITDARRHSHSRNEVTVVARRKA